MGKAETSKKARRFRGSTGPSPTPSEPKGINSQPRSRGQRKRLLKKASLVKRISYTCSSKRARRSNDNEEEEKLTDVPLASGSSVIETPATIQPRPPDQALSQLVLTNTRRKNLMAAEMEQLNAVLHTSSFQHNPFAAIQGHLRQTAASTSTSIRTQLVQPSLSAPRKGRSSNVGPPNRKPGRDKVAKSFKGRRAKMKLKRR